MSGRRGERGRERERETEGERKIVVDIQLCECRDRTELSTIPSITRSTVYRPYSKPNRATAVGSSFTQNYT